MNIVSVKFKKDGKAYYFDALEFELTANDYVLVETEKGLQFGIINEVGINSDSLKLKSGLKSILKKATKKDYDIYLKNLKDANDVVSYTKKLVEESDIQMRIVDASYTFDKKHLVINFIADERIDFRDLVKDLASKYKTHIELHQMGVRDKAKEIGGLGQCGLPLCCSSFRGCGEGISINMAKNQNISLNPSKINGCCGRLLCCLSYEDEVYTELKQNLPKINDEIKVDDELGKVVKMDILKKIATVDVNGELKEVDFND